MSGWNGWVRGSASFGCLDDVLHVWLAIVLIGTMTLGSAEGLVGQSPVEPPDGTLRVVPFGAGRPNAFYVASALIEGTTEVVLWDAQYRVSDGRRLADVIQATGKRLKAVVLSHADHDHHMGASAILDRFPDTPVYMSRAGLDDFLERAPEELAAEQARGGDDVPERLVTPRPWPDGGLEVDGHALEILDGLGGDVRGRKSAALWIPSVRVVLAGDLVFEGIHPWLGDSDIESRQEWRASLRTLAALDPVAVVPGHRRDPDGPDSPRRIDFMLRYLDDYDALMSSSVTPDELAEAMVERYPELELPVLMGYGARKWFKR